jgi:hypothetical protein
MGSFVSKDMPVSPAPVNNKKNNDPVVGVFLGGACNPTTWRRDVAIPALDAAGVTYYNPQVDDWTPDLMVVEAHQKATARYLLFVIGPETRALMTIAEAAHHIGLDASRVVLVLQPYPLSDDQRRAEEIGDNNRARDYLGKLAEEKGVVRLSTVDEAVAWLVGNLSPTVLVSQI